MTTDNLETRDDDPTEDVIQQADKQLGLSKQHLAQIFGISRQNLYNLLNNADQTPNRETEDRAKEVSKALKEISSICPLKLGASTLTVRIDDKRLFDVLMEKDICLQQVGQFTEQINKRITRQSTTSIKKYLDEQEEFLMRPNAV